LEEVSLADLGQMVLTAKADSKYDLPLIKLATFGNKLSEKGSLRHNDNVVSISGIEADRREVPRIRNRGHELDDERLQDPPRQVSPQL
jgi:hypothetical protein